MKGRTTTKRREAIESKWIQLDRLIEANDPNHYDTIRKLRQEMTFIRPDIIDVARDWCEKHNIVYICAPFEADWQLAMMCQQGFIQDVISEDSDMVVLGCPKVLMDINLADNSCSVASSVKTVSLAKVQSSRN